MAGGLFAYVLRVNWQKSRLYRREAKMYLHSGLTIAGTGCLASRGATQREFAITRFYMPAITVAVGKQPLKPPEMRQ